MDRAYQQVGFGKEHLSKLEQRRYYRDRVNINYETFSNHVTSCYDKMTVLIDGVLVFIILVNFCSREPSYFLCRQTYKKHPNVDLMNILES